MKLSEKILSCRKKAMLSQEALAERIGVSRQAISKWETGEATPEVTKLLALAQTFGVTTDWLLSEEEPIEETRTDPEPEPQLSLEEGWQKPQPEAAARTWVDAVPGMLGTLLRRYGWLFGVRLAVGGALFIAFGIFINLMSGTFFNTTSSSHGWMSSPLGSSSAIFYDENGNVIRDPERYFGFDIVSELGMNDLGAGNNGDYWDQGWYDFDVRGRSMFGLFSGFIMFIGTVMLIAGVVLAIELKKLNPPQSAS